MKSEHLLHGPYTSTVCLITGAVGLFAGAVKIVLRSAEMITNEKIAWWVLTAFGTLVCALGVFGLIKQKSAKQAAQSEFAQRYRILLDNTTSAMWEYDIATDTLHCSSRLRGNKENMFDVPDFRATLVSDGWVHPESVAVFNDFCSGFGEGKAHKRVELRMRSDSGRYRWYAVMGVTLHDAEGRPVSIFGEVVNIDAEKKRSDQLRENSEIDPLTRLRTRYAAERAVDKIIASRTSDQTQNGALIIIDVDQFKEINKNAGMMFGDALLIEMSGALRNLLSEECVIARVMGDEFVVFVPRYEREEWLMSKAAELCGCLRHCFLNMEKTERVTCSVGIARFPTDAQSYEQLFYKADIALFAAKQSGRNTYFIYTEELEEQISSQHGVLGGDAPVMSAKQENDRPVLTANSLLSQAIEILFESRELSVSINLILSLIGRRFGLDRCTVFEFDDDDENTVNASYMWQSEHTQDIRAAKNYPLSAVAPFAQYASGEDYYISNDAQGVKLAFPEVDKHFSDDDDVRAFLQCPVRNGARVCGYIGYAICRDGGVFYQDEIDELVLLSKIIGGYLVRLRTQRDMIKLDTTDKLTGVMSAGSFISEAERCITENPDKRYALVYLDIDRFKFINEKYGYKAGDNVLRRMARIMESLMDTSELLTRIDGDRFICLFNYNGSKQLEQRLGEFSRLLENIRTADGVVLSMAVRYGIYLVQSNESSITSCIDKANMARKSIKNIHVSTFVYFNDSMREHLRRRKEIEESMKDALAEGQFVVYFQPKFSLDFNEMVGAEALVRWERPGYGVLMPDKFIPLFEENGFIIELDFHVLEVVCRKLRRDIDNGMKALPVSVNFSRVHLKTDNFIEKLKQCLEKYDIPPRLVEIEITESALTDNEEYLYEIMTSLHDVGLSISMDDFGSGYSSLNLLKKLPFDVLKIDKNFFAQEGGTERERLIIANVVNMAKGLGIKVVSEGVETPEQANFLREIQCDMAQGYLYARPMDIKSFEKLYQENTI